MSGRSYPPVFLASVVVLVCAWPTAFGQLVGVIDLTQPRRQTQPEAESKADVAEKLEKFCIPNGGNADGDEINPDASALTLSVTHAELNASRDGLTLTVTTQLKNHGIGSTSIPWADHKIASAEMPSEKNAQMFGFEVATIDLFLGKAHTNDPMMTLPKEAALWMQPGYTGQSIKLNAGEWIDITFKSPVLCRVADPNECLKRLRRENLKVSAWWYQRLLTREMRGDCIYQTGAYTQHEIDSQPTELLVKIPDDLVLPKP